MAKVPIDPRIIDNAETVLRDLEAEYLAIFSDTVRFGQSERLDEERCAKMQVLREKIGLLDFSLELLRRRPIDQGL